MIESATVRTRKTANGRWLWAVPGMPKSGKCQRAEISPITIDAQSMPMTGCTRWSRNPRHPNSSPVGPPISRTRRKVAGPIRSGATDGGTNPMWWLAATRGSQQSHEIAKALTVKTMAERVGESLGRITGRCNGPVPVGLLCLFDRPDRDSAPGGGQVGDAQRYQVDPLIHRR